MNPNLDILDGFKGYARLFPLPNLVFFPQVMQPLHVFEPRYRQMTADALDDDKYIAIVLPRAGWEKDYAGKPAIHSVACLGKIIADQKLDDGRYNLLLRGVSRVRILEEVANGKLYRSARVLPLDDVPLEDAADEAFLRHKLLDLAPRMFPQPGEVKDEFRKLLMGTMPVGVLADIVAFALQLGVDFQTGNARRTRRRPPAREADRLSRSASAGDVVGERSEVSAGLQRELEYSSRSA